MILEKSDLKERFLYSPINFHFFIKVCYLFIKIYQWIGKTSYNLDLEKEILLLAVKKDSKVTTVYLPHRHTCKNIINIVLLSRMPRKTQLPSWISPFIVRCKPMRNKLDC